MSELQHVSGNGNIEDDEPPEHGINDGSGTNCLTHSYSSVDYGGKAVTRDESLTEILISRGVQEANLISAIVSLGEGEKCLCLVVIRINRFYILTFHSRGKHISNRAHRHPPPKLR
jgi:hypothetical protein